MLCSIIINNYNYARYLGKTIESALGQTYPDCEVVVVDDGSTDESVEVIRGYGARVVSILKSNGGQGSAMNAGFSKSRGDLILFLDADDWLEPNAVERVVAAFHEGTSHLYYKLAMKNPVGEALGEFKLELDELDAGADAWKAVIERGAVNFPPTSANVFSREALEAVLPMPEEPYRIRADVYLLHTVVFQGGVVALNEPLATYLVHGDNHWFKDGGKKKVGKRKPGLSRKNPKQFQKGILQARQKYDLLENGRQAKSARWGRPALERWIRLRWKQLLSLKCLPDTHPVSGDTLKSLSKEILEISSELGLVSVSLRIRLFLTRVLPGGTMSLFLFKK